MKKHLFLFLLLFPFVAINAQCFSIETVLVDACGDPEGENEMVTLRVYEQMDIANLVFDWPNNQFLNWCPNPTTTNLLNQTIISSCGFLLEPPNGIIPAGEKLIVVSSTNMLINANSFEGLNDTIYIIYQCAGNTAGHFSNLATSPRALLVSYNSAACSSQQTVSYIGANLIGGDGGAIFYSETGQATYYNTGCNAPVPAFNPFWNISSRICDEYGLIDLNDLLSGNATLGGTWSGAVENNHFFNSIGKSGNYSITYTIEDSTSCLESADSTINFIVESANFGRDTIIRCDSILQFGFWITSDTILDIPIQNSNSFRCDSTLKRLYKINQSSFNIEPESIVLNSGESFNFNIEGSNSFTYQFWNEQGDTCFTSCVENNITPINSENYFFEVKDEVNSCSQILSINVQLNYFSELNIPTVFTPNNDGQNDFFKLYAKDIQELKFQIYSRWGELIFEGNDASEFWDGTFKNKELASGLFLVQIKASGKDGQRYDLLKKIKLIR